MLFVADPVTGEVEEVGEGVDYGVRRRTSSTGMGGKGKGREDGAMGLSEDEKFLKGVSIYLKKHLFANSVTQDLWEGIQEASGMCGFLLRCVLILKIATRHRSIDYINAVFADPTAGMERFQRHSHWAYWVTGLQSARVKLYFGSGKA